MPKGPFVFGNLPPFIGHKDILTYRVIVHIKSIADFIHPLRRTLTMAIAGLMGSRTATTSLSPSDHASKGFGASGASSTVSYL